MNEEKDSYNFTYTKKLLCINWSYEYIEQIQNSTTTSMCKELNTPV